MKAARIGGWNEVGDSTLRRTAAQQLIQPDRDSMAFMVLPRGARWMLLARAV